MKAVDRDHYQDSKMGKGDSLFSMYLPFHYLCSGARIIIGMTTVPTLVPRGESHKASDEGLRRVETGL